MTIRYRRPPSWLTVGGLVLANLVLAVDGQLVVGIPPLAFTTAYALTAILLVAWRLTGNREVLSIVGGLITVTAGTRATMFAVFADLYAASAAHLLIGVYGFAWMLTQTETDLPPPAAQ